MAGAAGSRRDVAVAGYFDGRSDGWRPGSPVQDAEIPAKMARNARSSVLRARRNGRIIFAKIFRADVTAEAVMTKLLIVGVAVCATLSAGVAAAQTPAKAASAAVTFTKDVAPILQRSCQNCHRPGQMAPMSLLTYQDVRPWVRSIKQRVVAREMPPWGIDPHIGIQSFKNDPSLRDDEIQTIANGSTAGAPMGNAADMPKPREFDDADRWHIGKPDVIVTSPNSSCRPKRPTGGAATTSTPASPKTATSRRSKASPGKAAVVHQLLTYAVGRRHDRRQQRRRQQSGRLG
jgi:hypothetical protein